MLTRKCVMFVRVSGLQRQVSLFPRSHSTAKCKPWHTFWCSVRLHFWFRKAKMLWPITQSIILCCIATRERETMRLVACLSVVGSTFYGVCVCVCEFHPLSEIFIDHKIDGHLCGAAIQVRLDHRESGNQQRNKNAKSVSEQKMRRTFINNYFHEAATNGNN